MNPTSLQHLAKSLFFILQATKRRVSFEWTLIAGENAGKPRISFTGNEKKLVVNHGKHILEFLGGSQALARTHPRRPKSLEN